MREIDSNHSRFSRRCVGQRYDHGVSVYDFAYVRCNHAQNLPQIEARRDFGRQIEEQLKPLFAEADAQVAFVSLDKEPEKAAEWFQQNMKEPELFLKHLYLDPKFVTADLLKVDAFPMTLVVGRDGKVAHVQRGFKEGEHSTEEIVKVATRLLKAAKT